MAKSQRTITSLAEAIEFFDETMARRPERDALAALEAALAGGGRPYPVLYLSHLASPADKTDAPPEFTPPEVKVPQTPEGGLARDIIGLLGSLDMLNPVHRVFGLGSGPGTLVTCFGIPLNPEAQNVPAYAKSLDQVLSEPPPDPKESGMMPEMRERIALIKAHIPNRFKIGLPDMQGPFNLVHSTIGEEALTAPYLEPEKFRAFMERMTTLWLGARRALMEWIGPEYMHPGERIARITECSVNLVSPDLYRQHILPHDRRVAEELGPLHIHPCSGPHVFHVTLENLPVVVAEAGFVETATAGSIRVGDALAAIGGRPILLHIGQELPPGREEETIRSDLDLYRGNPRLVFAYTGMYWRKKDRPGIRAMHRRLDEHWEKNLTRPSAAAQS